MIYAVTLYIEAEDVEDVIRFLSTIETKNIIDFEINRADVYEKKGNDNESLYEDNDRQI